MKALRDALEHGFMVECFDLRLAGPRRRHRGEAGVIGVGHDMGEFGRFDPQQFRLHPGGKFIGRRVSARFQPRRQRPPGAGTIPAINPIGRESRAIQRRLQCRDAGGGSVDRRGPFLGLCHDVRGSRLERR